MHSTPTTFYTFLPQILLYLLVDHKPAAHTPACPTLHQLARTGMPVCRGCEPITLILALTGWSNARYNFYMGTAHTVLDNNSFI